MRFHLSSTTVFLAATGLFLSACATPPGGGFDNADYWERASIEEAAFVDSAVLQKTLHKDIATCVRAVRDIERLAPMREAFPPEYSPGADGDIDKARLERWQTPEREGMLRTEAYPYVDFETCMRHHGWQRTRAMPKEMARESRAQYLTNMGYDTKPAAKASYDSSEETIQENQDQYNLNQ